MWNYQLPKVAWNTGFKLKNLDSPTYAKFLLFSPLSSGNFSASFLTGSSKGYWLRCRFWDQTTVFQSKVGSFTSCDPRQVTYLPETQFSYLKNEGNNSTYFTRLNFHNNKNAHKPLTTEQNTQKTFNEHLILISNNCFSDIMQFHED